jgi:UDP-N-acetylmuramate--alanine ligase
VYSAGEDAIPGADSRSLCRSIRARGRIDPVYVQDDEDIRKVLTEILRDGDIVITQGAGSVGLLARQLGQQGLILV